jgi:hypothetical protein
MAKSSSRGSVFHSALLFLIIRDQASFSVCEMASAEVFSDIVEGVVSIYYMDLQSPLKI